MVTCSEIRNLGTLLEKEGIYMNVMPELVCVSPPPILPRPYYVHAMAFPT